MISISRAMSLEGFTVTPDWTLRRDAQHRIKLLFGPGGFGYSAGSAGLSEIEETI
jgi:hypothetical protein